MKRQRLAKTIVSNEINEDIACLLRADMPAIQQRGLSSEHRHATLLIIIQTKQKGRSYRSQTGIFSFDTLDVYIHYINSTEAGMYHSDIPHSSCHMAYIGSKITCLSKNCHKSAMTAAPLIDSPIYSNTQTSNSYMHILLDGRTLQAYPKIHLISHKN